MREHRIFLPFSALISLLLFLFIGYLIASESSHILHSISVLTLFIKSAKKVKIIENEELNVVKQILNSNLNAIFLINRDGLIITQNSAAEKTNPKPNPSSIYEILKESEKNVLQEKINAVLTSDTENISVKLKYADKELTANISSYKSLNGTMLAIVAFSENSCLAKYEEIESRLHALIDSFDDIIFEIAPDLSILDVFTSNESELFIPKNQIIGKNCIDLFGPFGTFFNEKLQEAKNANQRIEFEYPSPFDASLWYRARVKNINGSAGNLIVIIENISKAHAASQELIEKNKLLEEMLTNIPLTVFEYNKQGKLKSIEGNYKYYTDIKIPKERINQFNVFQVDDNITKHLQKGFEKTPYKYSLWYKERYLETYLFKVSPNSEYITGISIDLTDLKKTELQLKEKEYLLKESQTIANMGSWVRDIQSDEYFANEEYYTLLGLPMHSNPKLTDVVKNVHPDDSPEFTRLSKHLVEDGVSMDTDIRYIIPTQKEKYLNVKASKIIDERGRNLIIGTITDITKRKEIEKRLIKINDSKDHMLAIVAHDLRNPIANIQALSELLKNKLRSESEKQYMLYIEESCNIANNIINDLLEISTLEDDSFTLKKSICNVNELLLSTIENHQSLANNKSIKLSTLFETNPLRVELNNNKFNRVIENLLSNALKFTNENGEIKINTCQKDNNCVIEISDNGIGIPEILLPSLFEKFTKAKRTGLQGEKTTGLGLYIAKTIINLHNGKLEAKSEEGKGTSMIITLPIAPFKNE